MAVEGREGRQIVVIVFMILQSLSPPNELGRCGVVVVQLPLPDDLREVAEPQHALLLALARHLARYPVPPLLAPLGELRQRGLQRDLQSLQYNRIHMPY